MSISDQGWAAITAMEHANSAAYDAKKDAIDCQYRLIVEHLNRDHGFGVAKIARDLKMKQGLVKDILKVHHEV